MALYHLTVSQIRAQRRTERHCRRSLPGRGASLQRLLRRVQRLHPQGRRDLFRNFVAAPCPPEYQDRATLWNTVEQVEKHPKAQLAYSFDIALQNELSMEENIALAREFVQRCLVDKGMIADFAVHAPDKEDGGIPNPHFHVMTTMRPINPDGTWGQKQRREYVLDDEGNRVLDKNGKPMFNAVPTTDWRARKRWNTGGSSGAGCR